MTQLQRELAARDSELAIRADEVASLREAQRGAQSQINQYIADLQVRGGTGGVVLGSLHVWTPAMVCRAVGPEPVHHGGRGKQARNAPARPATCSCYCHCPPLSLPQAIPPSCPVLQAYERQLDSLSRAMHRSDNVAEGLDQERQALLDQLRAAEQASRACGCCCAWIRFVHRLGRPHRDGRCLCSPAAPCPAASLELCTMHGILCDFLSLKCALRLPAYVHQPQP